MASTHEHFLKKKKNGKRSLLTAEGVQCLIIQESPHPSSKFPFQANFPQKSLDPPQPICVQFTRFYDSIFSQVVHHTLPDPFAHSPNWYFPCIFISSNFVLHLMDM